VDTYCKTYLIAKQIGAPLCTIPHDKIDEILRRKKAMGLPDARMGRLGAESQVVDSKYAAEIDALVERVTARMESEE
jgi:hypothetical protein